MNRFIRELLPTPESPSIRIRSDTFADASAMASNTIPVGKQGREGYGSRSPACEQQVIVCAGSIGGSAAKRNRAIVRNHTPPSQIRVKADGSLSHSPIIRSIQQQGGI
jgi:hypothetical protein